MEIDLLLVGFLIDGEGGAILLSVWWWHPARWFSCIVASVNSLATETADEYGRCRICQLYVIQGDTNFSADVARAAVSHAS